MAGGPQAALTLSGQWGHSRRLGWQGWRGEQHRAWLGAAGAGPGDSLLYLCLSNRGAAKEEMENVGSADLKDLLQSSKSLWVYLLPAMRCILLSQFRPDEPFASKSWVTPGIKTSSCMWASTSGEWQWQRENFFISKSCFLMKLLDTSREYRKWDSIRSASLRSTGVKSPSVETSLASLKLTRS